MTEETKQGEQVTENIWLCPDGVYRWSYEFDMLRNPTILFTVWKVLGISFGVVFLFSFFISLFTGSIGSAADIWGLAKGFLILLAVFLVIGVIAYFIVAYMYGWKYMVLFEMTEEYVRHIQMEKQFKKAEAVGWITLLAGLMAGKPSVAAIGLTSATKNESTSIFEKVEFIKVRRRRHTIHVNQLLDKNQVYAEDADFDFVESFILAHCTKAKLR